MAGTTAKATVPMADTTTSSTPCDACKVELKSAGERAAHEMTEQHIENSERLASGLCVTSAEAAAAGDLSVIACTSCRVRVYGVAARHQHYKSELHVVNVQRKTAALPGFTLSEFAARLAAVRVQAAADGAAASGTRRSHHCGVCAKRFSSERALENHIGSRRHRDALRARAPSEVTVEGSDEEEDAMEHRLAEASEIPPTVCVFDGHVSETVEANVAYMAATFGFYLPYVDALDDIEGLLVYLGMKVGLGYACVECDKAFASVPAVQHHMRSKQHCRMTADDDVWVAEYASFYEFGNDVASEGDVADGDEADGWEEVPAEEVAAVEADSTTIAVIDEKSRKAALSRLQPLGGGAPGVHGSEDVSLVVNGKVLGHRSLLRYYKQSYPSSAGGNRTAIERVLNEYRLLGWKGHRTIPKEVVKAARVQAVQKRRFDLKVGVKNYYTRKSAIKPSMAVFNSGYRP